MLQSLHMVTIQKTDTFNRWLDKLRDKPARLAIQMRINRLKIGMFGDCKNVGEKVFELRIDCGQGYRVYFMNNGAEIILLLCGGNKSTQQQDIQKAKEIAKG